MAKKSTSKNAPIKNPFGDIKGEKFGGGSNHLKIEPGEVIHGFVHIRIDPKVQLDKTSEPIDLHVAIDPRTKEEIRMPASAVFRKNIELAKLNAGDVYSVARDNDTPKKAGKGKGNMMSVYQLLVTKRK